MNLVVPNPKASKGQSQSSNPKLVDFTESVSYWLVCLPSSEGSSRLKKIISLQIMEQIVNGIQWNKAQNFVPCLLWSVDFPALLVRPIMNIPFTTSCQFICLPIFHNILEDSYRNWEIWVYKTKYLLWLLIILCSVFYIIHIFLYKLLVKYLNSHLLHLYFVRILNIVSKT